MGFATSIAIIEAFCKQEIFGEATELIQFLVDLDDDTCPIKFYQEPDTSELEAESILLNSNEPDQYANYDAWCEWDEKIREIDDKIAEMEAEAAIATYGISEWHLCTAKLGDKLKEHGEFVIYYETFAIWGRKNVALLQYDETIRQIAKELEILPGMKNDWSKYIEQEEEK